MEETKRENALREIETQELELLHEELRGLQRETEEVHSLTKEN